MSEPASGITIERSQRREGGNVWWWISGETYPHREVLNQAGAHFSRKRQAWYFIGKTLPDTIRALDIHATAPSPKPEMPLELERQILAVLAEDDARTKAEPIAEHRIELQDLPRQLIRVIPPSVFPVDAAELDDVQRAIRETMGDSRPLHRALVASGVFSPITQSFCGEIAGSITGQVFCYGYAVHDGVTVYINMAGPRMAVEAIRAKLSKGEHVSVVPPDAPSVELSAGEGSTGMYHAYLHYLPEARFASLILVHDLAVTPNYAGKSTTFIFRTSDVQATAKLARHVTQLVNVPVFEAWSGYLYEAGQKAMLVRKTRAEGGIDLLSVDLDIDAWTRLITGGLQHGVITLPISQ